MSVSKSFAARLCACAAAAAFCLIARADAAIWYVDDDADASVADGSQSKPYATLQAAADAASAGDSVRVAAGTYDSGSTNIATATGDIRCRLYVNKKLHFIAADGNGTAHIVGARDDDDPNGSNGMGANAIRCVYVDYSSASKPLGADTVFEGFTFRDGHSCYTNLNASGTTHESPANFGGALYVNTSSKRAYLVDCVVSNCTARYGGAIQGGTAIRTLFADNGGMSGAAMRSACAVNCVLTRNTMLSQTSLAAGSTLVNCTAVGNDVQWTMNGTCVVNNTISINSGTRLRYDEKVTDANCVAYPESSHASAREPAPHGPGQTLASFDAGWRPWRPVSVGDAVGAGDASHLADVTVPEGSGIDVYKDFYGEGIPQTGAIQAGAVQTVATPAGSGLYFIGKSLMTLEGRPVGTDAWIYPETYPTQFAFKAAAGEKVLQRVERRSPLTGGEDLKNYPPVYPQLNGDFLYMMPSPDITLVLTNKAWAATDVLWVSPDADAESADGSFDRPYRTLQKAFAAAPDSKTSDAVIVYAKPGTYAEGVATNSTYGKFRLGATPDKNVLFRAVAGPGETFIAGSPDATALDDEDFPGCGPEAVNCVLSTTSKNFAIQGFTLKDGCTAAEDANNNLKRGAFVAGGNVWPVALDCVITNIQSTYNVTYGAVLQRCRLAGNHAMNSITYSGYVSSCHYGSNHVAEVGTSANGYFNAVNGRAYHCTIIGTPEKGRVSGVGNYFNCIVDGGNNIYNGSGTVVYYRSIVHNYGNSTSNASDWTNVDPLFENRAADGTLRSDSPAFTHSYVPTMENYGADYFRYATSDVNGAPIRFTDGKPALGAFQVPVEVATVTVAAPDAKGGYSVTTGATGANVLHEGEEVVIELAAGTRPCAGVTVGGVEHRFADSEDHAIHLTFEMAKAAGGSLAVEGGLFTTDWYVDDDGDDENTGFTPFDAKKTLATAANALAAGDTLWVLPGTYATGSNLHAKASFIPSRVVVKSDTTVRSTEGPEKTVIVGAAATEDADGLGCGTNAIRCAALSGKGAVLSGFTLTGGRTHRVGVNENICGGGVIGSSSSARDFSFGEIVENCIISNNVAVMGSAAAWCQLVGCRVTGNVATNNSYSCVVSQGSVFATFIDGNEMPGNVFYYSANVCGSTIGPNNVTAAGTAVSQFGTPGFTPNTKGRIYNSLFCGKVGVGSGAMEIRNSVFLSTSTFHANSDRDETVVLATIEKLGLNDDGSPKIGVNPAIGAADFSLYDFDFSDTAFNATDLKYVAKSREFIDAWCRGAKDLNGKARIANGTPDVGCFEADWHGEYSKILGGGCAVTAASSNAVAEVGGTKVTLGGGELEVSWGPDSGQAQLQSYTMHARVTGAGTLTVTANGEEMASFGASAGDVAIPFKSELAANELTFSYEPGENDAGGAELWGFSRRTGTLITVR